MIYSIYFLHWYGLVNTVVFLQNDHRFKDDPEYGRLVERFSNGKATKNDIKSINSRLLNDGWAMVEYMSCQNKIQKTCVTHVHLMLSETQSLPVFSVTM